MEVATEITVIKRNGATLPFNVNKIVAAISGAFHDSTESAGPEDMQDIADSVWRTAAQRPDGKIRVESIQDLIEEELIDRGFVKTARIFIAYRAHHNHLRQERRLPDNEAIEDFVLASKYSRFLPEENRREVYEEVVDRVMNMHIRRYPEVEKEIRWAFEQVQEKRVLPSMRSMQFGGSGIEKNHVRMYNCAYGLCNRPEFFSQMLFLLLCGTGVGFSVEQCHVAMLPKLGRVDQDAVQHYEIPDTIEGWADALKELMSSYFTSSSYVEFNYSKIRQKGEPLKSSGGKAPGHLPLKRALENIRSILDRASNRHLKPIECYDIVMHAADCVIAGGVRRSATICLFSPEDEEMMNAKTGNWFQDNPQRGRSNNSVKLVHGKTEKAQFVEAFNKQKEWGEPGFYFAENEVYGSNPCVEIGLNPVDGDVATPENTGWQFCNLTEINGAKLKTHTDFVRAVQAAAMIGTLQAGYTHFPYLGEITEKLCRREALLGVSITGMMDAPDIAFDPQVQSDMAKLAVATNQVIAEKIGINSAARVTCVKPAGTTSLVLGTASGAHPRHARRYFRRVQANTQDPVYRYFKQVNPHMCEASVWSSNKTDDVITFPIQAPDKAITRHSISAVEFLKKVHSTQKNWVLPGNAKPNSSPGLQHNVSNTITVDESEWDEVMEFIWEHRKDFTGISMLAKTGDKDYPQAPHEAVSTDADEVRWNTLIEHYRPVDYKGLKEEQDDTSPQSEMACAGGKCDL